MPRAGARKIKLARKARYNLPFIIAGILLALIFVSVRLLWPPNRYNARLNGKYLQLEVSSTDAARERGLGGRSGLRPNQGMLFIFDTPGEYCFWMKDMKFAIDILWFDANQQLVYQQDDASPASYPESFCPPMKAQYVVELPTGTARQLDLRNGASLELVKR